MLDDEAVLAEREGAAAAVGALEGIWMKGAACCGRVVPAPAPDCIGEGVELGGLATGAGAGGALACAGVGDGDVENKPKSPTAGDVLVVLAPDCKGLVVAGLGACGLA